MKVMSSMEGCSNSLVSSSLITTKVGENDFSYSIHGPCCYRYTTFIRLKLIKFVNSDTNLSSSGLCVLDSSTFSVLRFCLNLFINISFDLQYWPGEEERIFKVEQAVSGPPRSSISLLTSNLVVESLPVERSMFGQKLVFNQ